MAFRKETFAKQILISDRRRTRVSYRADEKEFKNNVGKLLSVKSYLKDLDCEHFLPNINTSQSYYGNGPKSSLFDRPQMATKTSNKPALKLPPIKP